MAGLDQEVQITDTELKVFDTVDSVVSKSVTAGDPIPAFTFAGELIRSGQIRGLALAKLLYEMKSKWALFQQAGIDDNFEDVAFAHIGRSAETILKYTRMWENIFANDGISEVIKRKLMGKDIGDLLLMTATIREGVDDKTMSKLLNAPDKNSLRDIIAESRGGDRTSSSNAVRIFIQLRDEGKYPRGCVYVKQGNESHIVGTLDVDSDDELVKKAIARITNSSGIVEVN